MNRGFILLVVIVCMSVFYGCHNHSGLISASDIKMIKLVRYRTPTDSITQTYTSSGEIDHIVDGLNGNKKEAIYFTNPDCDIHIIYADSTVNILCRGNTMKCKGATYQLTNSMEEILY